MYYIPELAFFDPGQLVSNLTNFALSPGGIMTGFKLYQQQEAQKAAEKGQEQQFQIEQQRTEAQKYTAEQKLKTDLEIQRLKNQAALRAQTQAGGVGLTQTKYLVFGGLGVIALMGGVILLSRKGKKK